ncbi:LegC family aminotransferase [Schleiferiaceae bacterium]|nr:LegC family aminotransferase [Schleiferiaceae bacterium]
MKTDPFNLFVRELYQSKDDFIPLHVPVFNGKEKEYLLETIDSTFVSSVGKYVDQVESFLAEYTKTSKGVAVVNGTAAIQVALRLVGVGPSDEVITQALTFVATANSIAYNGAKPVFIDVDKDTMGMSPKALEAFLEEFGEKRDQGVYNRKTGKRISAVLPMHTFGFMCRISEIQTICNEWGIPCVEDAAEALGSQSEGKSAGSFGKLGAFSFNGNKIITAGGGGVIVSNETALGIKAKYVTTTAKRPHAFEYFHDELGYNFRMPNVNAALLLAQLEKLEDYRASKSLVYAKYQSFFETNIKGADLMPIPETTSQWNYWLMSVQLENREARDEFLNNTNSQGIMTRPIWQLMYKLPMYSDCQRDDQLNAEYLEDTIVNIPSSAINEKI